MENNKGNTLIRLLRADEIECRAATVNKNGLSLLLYKDARVDQKILDETSACSAGSLKPIPFRGYTSVTASREQSAQGRGNGRSRR